MLRLLRLLKVPMKTVKKLRKSLLLGTVLLLALAGSSVLAGTYTNNFEDPNFFGTAYPNGNAIITNVFLTNGVLELTAPINSEAGAFDLEDLDAGSAISSFTANFKLELGPGSGTPADGFSFVFGPDVTDVSSFSEEGPGVPSQSVCVEFDVYDNGGHEAPAIDVKLFGIEIAHTPMPIAALETSKLENVFIQLNANGTLNVSYAGQVVYTNLYLPGWVWTFGHFGFNARTGGLNEECDIDNIVIQSVVAPTTPVAPTVSVSPSTVTASEGTSQLFTAAFNGTPPFAFQWSENGSAIAGATTSTLSLGPVSSADNSAKITCTVSNAVSSVTSSGATLTVTPYSTGPSVVKAAAVQSGGGYLVGVTFSQFLNASATTLANYSIPGGAISAATYDPTVPGVVLTVSGLTVGSTNTVTVSNVANDDGITMAASGSATFIIRNQVTSLTDQDVGTPTLAGSLTTTLNPFLGSAVFKVVGGGNDIWNTSDNFNYAYTMVSGDFDYVVDVNSLLGPDNWTKAELMARAPTSPSTTPTGPDAFVANMTTQTPGFVWDSQGWVFFGQNDVELQDRDTANGNPGGASAFPLYPPTYPNTWLRLTRVSGTNFILKASPDGKNWTFISSHSVSAANFPNSLFLGLAVTAHNDTDTNGGTAVFTGFSAFTPVPVAITNQPPANISGLEGRSVSFSVGATGDPLNYQWQKGGIDIPGATSSAVTLNNLQMSDAGMYDVRVFNSASTATSSSVNLSVIPYPPIPSASAMTRNDGVVEVGVAFDEPVNLSSLVQGNFSLNTGSVTGLKIATNSFVTYESAVLQTTGLTPGSSYVLTIKNVSDLNGNTITSTNVNFTVGQLTWAETGTPITPGQVIPVGSNGFDILNGGRQEWGTYDEVTMAYVIKTNDFDVRVQVVYAEPASEWARVGMQARNSLNVGEPTSDRTNTTSTVSAYAQTHVNPAQTLASSGAWNPSDPIQPVNPTPNDSHEQNCRLAAGAATQGWGSAGTAPTYPNAWLRLQRTGTNIFGYRSSDGVNWTSQGSVSLTDQQSYMYVGMSLGVETGNIWPSTFDVWNAPFDPNYDRLFVAQFRNFGDVPSVVVPAPIAIKRQASSVVLSWGVSGILQQSPAVGPAASWTPVAGAPNTPTGGSFTNTPSGTALFFRLKEQ